MPSCRCWMPRGRSRSANRARKGRSRFRSIPGKHRLKVEKDGFQFFSQDFVMESGGKQSINAALEPMSGGAAPKDPAFEKWMKEVAALPAEQQVEAADKRGFSHCRAPGVLRPVDEAEEIAVVEVTGCPPL